MNRNITTRSVPSLRRRFCRRGEPRRGVIVVLFLFFMVIAMLAAALTLNWSYLVLVQRDMQWRGHAIALAAAPALLDEDLLRDDPADQSDDLSDAVTLADAYRQLNNLETGARLQIEAVDVLVDAGRVDHIEQLIGPGNTYQISEPYNTLRVRILRDATGANPVEPLVSANADPNPVDVNATTYVTLDNHLVGWRPTATANAPLLPISVLAADWATRSVSGSDIFPGPPNGIKELIVRLDSSDSLAADGNAVLLSLDTTEGVSIMEVLEQIAEGAEFDDLNGGEISTTVTLNALAESPSQVTTGMLVSKLNAEVGTCRILPLHATPTTTGEVNVIGYAGVRIMDAEDEDPSGEHRLKLTVEPCFVIHFTAWTEQSAAANPWIHKMRVRR